PTPVPTPIPRTIQNILADFPIPPAANPGFPPNAKYDVYSGPGTYYHRGANGKAKVSTNDWINVYGVDGEWALIEYEVSVNKWRQGYIQAINLPTSYQKQALHWAWISENIIYNCNLTDDPNLGREPLFVLEKGASVTLLATYRDLVYVECEASGELVRGYIEKGALGFR
ncbi:MAG: hypothetical protein GX786_05030, partial [Clostridiales bacterium]|nr:hypothetical protein [Clostridiales bacterium]